MKNCYRIRALRPEELPKLRGLIDLANSEIEQVNFDKRPFEQSWGNFISSEIGLVLALETKEHEVIGAFGGMIYANPNSGNMTASQVFWFMHPEKRGPGANLLSEFEAIARDMGCTQIFTTNIINRRSGRMSKMFRRKGYRPIEIHWAKELTT
jgi:hypothetical protein